MSTSTGTSATASLGGGYVIRSIRPDDWPRVKQLRLEALRDPVAHLAFLETYEEGAAKADAFWQDRAAGSGEGSTTVRQFVAEASDGTWAGSVTVIMEEPGTKDWAGYPVEHRQGHVVGVYVRPQDRGNGLIKALFEVGVGWAREQGAERARLLVHEENVRAQGAYRKAGFVPSGVVVPYVKDAVHNELEFVLDWES
ncbi:GNAT family N-acetyltransferase [Streptomyces sp. NPDC046759]|uniref:GNAT family N-acetyltransferase n=1 Tax=Streptomyces sp. NPDC046759 TaxID=3155019 RepID=UPI0033F1E9A0